MTHAEIITELADLRRRVANLIHFGVIAEADYSRAAVRVTLGSIKTDWLPWLTARAGGDTVWHAPEVGEQVMVVSPSGDIGNGVVMPALYSDAKPANAAAATVHRTTYADGAVIEYDRAAHEFKITTPGAITFTAASITFNAPTVTASGAILAQGDITNNGGAKGSLGDLQAKYNAHKHGTSPGTDQPVS